MECYIAKEAFVNPKQHLLASIEWLKSMGGGTVVSDLRRNLEGTLGKRGGEFDRFVEDSAMHGVTITWRRKGLPHNGNVVAAFTTPDVLHMLDESEDIDALLVLGWSENDWRWWSDKHDPMEMIME